MNDSVKSPVARLSVGAATALVVGNMIGSGVFTSLGFQAAEIKSGFLLLSIWAIGGVIALCGALSYAELASAMPRSGGEYNFLSQLYHPLVGFLSGWVSVTVGFAAPVALAAMAFGTYLSQVVESIDPLTASLVLLLAATIVFLSPIRIGSRFLTTFVILNLTILFVLIASAFGLGGGSEISFLPKTSEFGGGVLTPLAISLVYVMYSYSGWNSSTYIVDEIRDPRRSVPRSLVLGTLLVTAVYVAVNAAFLYSTPLAELEGQLEVGLIAARNILGEGGGNFMAILICIGLVASVSAMTWAGPRVAMAMGEDYRALRVFNTRNRFSIPWVAVIWQSLIATGMLFTSTFESVLTYIELILILSSFFAVLGVVVLRRKRPEQDWPYKTWGYPVTPAIFCAMSLFIMAFVLKSRPVESFYGLLTLIVGAALWAAVQRGHDPGHLSRKGSECAP
jgi:APA family basic amino acid/polyamine antiporter